MARAPGPKAALAIVGGCAVLLVALLARERSSESWSGFVYPNRWDLTRHVEIGSFPTLDQCRAAALDKLAALHSDTPTQGDYECGLNCRGDSYPLTCDKTEH